MMSKLLTLIKKHLPGEYKMFNFYEDMSVDVIKFHKPKHMSLVEIQRNGVVTFFPKDMDSFVICINDEYILKEDELENFVLEYKKHVEQCLKQIHCICFSEEMVDTKYICGLSIVGIPKEE